jgi:hypothetical protein
VHLLAVLDLQVVHVEVVARVERYGLRARIIVVLNTYVRPPHQLNDSNDEYAVFM